MATGYQWSLRSADPGRRDNDAGANLFSGTGRLVRGVRGRRAYGLQRVSQIMIISFAGWVLVVVFLVWLAALAFYSNKLDQRITRLENEQGPLRYRVAELEDRLDNTLGRKEPLARSG